MLAPVLVVGIVWYWQLVVAFVASIALVMGMLIGDDPAPVPDPPPSWSSAVAAPVDADFSWGGR